MVGGASLSWDIRGDVFRGPISRVLRSCKDLPSLAPSQRPPSAPKAFVAFNIRSSVGTGEKNTLQTHLCTTHKKIPTHFYNSSFRTFLFVP